MAGYKIQTLSLGKYFYIYRKDITAIDKWRYKDNEIVARTKKIAPDVP